MAEASGLVAALDAAQDRPTIDVVGAAGGWTTPWPSLAEIAAALPNGRWTLVGGLMTQLHTIHHGPGIVRATNDVDIVLHIETPPDARGLRSRPEGPEPVLAEILRDGLALVGTMPRPSRRKAS